MTAVKICGLTRPEDVVLACDLGASYVGFNFAKVSPRRVTPEQSRRLAEAISSGTARVGVFVGEDYRTIADAVEAASLDFVQIHRPLEPGDLEGSPRPVIAVAHVRAGAAALPPPELLARCGAILFDTRAPGRAGGTGERFDWSLLEGNRWPIPLFLAGGLDANAVGMAIRRVRPAAVDVASGVESAPGIKDPERMRRFFEAVRQADSAPSPSGRGPGARGKHSPA